MDADSFNPKCFFFERVRSGSDFEFRISFGQRFSAFGLRGAYFFDAPGLIQRHATPDIGRDIEVFAFVNRRLALIKPALGNYFQRQLGLAQFRKTLSHARRVGALLRQDALHLVRGQCRRRGHKAGGRPRVAGFFEQL